MILSMTGYGTVSLQNDGATVVAEVRTVNHRFLDLHVRLSREYSFLEAEITQLVKEHLRRGRVDVSLTIQTSLAADSLINLDAARRYAQAAEKLRAELHLTDPLDLRTLLEMPGVLQGQTPSALEAEGAGTELRELARRCIQSALQTVLSMRRQEGVALESEMRGYLESIRSRVEEVNHHLPAVQTEYRQRLEERLKYLLPQVTPDPQRLAQEVALLVEKSDISEEITRLESHIDQFNGVLNDGKEIGKKMDFLLQEMHREINTAMSKTGNLEVTRHGIAIKSDIEKLREQVQNIE
jgi:uncharacterized protein (TIGR00255 family)